MAIIKKFRIKSFKNINSIIKFENVSIAYGNRTVLDNINFKINEDENSINYGKPYIENIPCFNFFTPDKIWRNIIYGTHR